MKRILSSLAIIAIMVSCNKENTNVSSTRLNSVQAHADGFTFDRLPSRTALNQNGTKAPTFSWKDGDVIGVIPMDGKTVQSNFTIAEIDSDPGIAIFDGGVWALKEGQRYAAYYPYSKIAADSGDKIEFSFLSQVQGKNNSLEHLGPYDYMYAPSVFVTDDITSFNFKHLISLIRLQITVPQTDEYTSVTLESTTAWFAAKAELLLADGAMTATQTLKSYSVVLDNITVPANEILTVWLAILPTNALNGRKLTVTISGKHTERSVEVPGPETFEAGKAYSITCSAVTPQSEIEWIDLGLNVKWANVNLGANAPEEYGDYYAWGELEPYYEVGAAQLTWKDGKSAGYAWGSYIWCNGSSTSMTKYCIDPSYGIQDDATALSPEDDAAYAILGGQGRIPTGADFQEMLDNCKTEWTKLNGVNGLKVTGQNNNSIFLPATGYRTGTGWYLGGLYGYYWSSSLSETKSCNAHCLYFSQYMIFTNNNEINNRCYGQTIRPVTD